MPLFGTPNVEKMKVKRDLKGLVKALAYRKSADVRESAAQALETLGWQPDNSEAGAAYWAVKHQWDRCIEIGRPAVEPLLIALDQEKAIRLPAAAALGKIGDARATSSLVAALEDEDADMRGAALEGLKRIGEPAVPQLIVALKKDAHGKVYDPEKLVEIVQLSQHTDTPMDDLVGDLVIPAAEALVRIGAPAVEPVIATLMDADWKVQFVAIRVLEQIGDVRAAEPLRVFAEASSAKAGKVKVDRNIIELAERATAIIVTVRAAEALYQLTRVYAMLAIYIHDPDALLTDLPSGDRLKPIAAETLQRHDPTQKLHASAYVRTVVSGGGLSIAEQVVQARSDAPGMMKDVLQERELDAEDYKHEVWAEELSPKIKVVWVAAIRK